MRSEPWVSCEEAFRRLDDYVDRALNERELWLVAEHLDRCVKCAREFQFEETILHEVREKLGHLKVPPSLVDRVRGQLARVARPPT